MNMKRIDTLQCNRPILFKTSWGALLLWLCTFTIGYVCNLWEHGTLNFLGFFILPFSMFLMFCSLDWREVENFAFFLHPGRLRQIGYDYLVMYVLILLLLFDWMGVIIIKILFTLSIIKYMYDMLKLAGKWI